MISIGRMVVALSAVVSIAGGATLPFADLADICGPFADTAAHGGALYRCRLGEAEGLSICAYWSSENTGKSPLLGRGWCIPVLESRFVPVEDGAWEFHQPDGFVRRFVRQLGGVTNTLCGGYGLLAQIGGDRARIVYGAPGAAPGAVFTFRQGRLVRMQCEEGDFEFRYSKRICDRIVSGGRTLLKVTRSEDGSQVGLDFVGTGRSATFRCGTVQTFVARGETSVATIMHERCPVEVTLASGKVRHFEYGGENGTAFFSVDGRRLEWNPLTRAIVSAGGWDYKIDFPDIHSCDCSFSRTDSDGRTEYYFNNRFRGHLVRKSANGEKLEQKVFTDGASAGRLRWREITDVYGSCTRKQYRYDEKGRLFGVSTTIDGEEVTE